MSVEVQIKECPLCKGRMLRPFSGPFMCEGCDYSEDLNIESTPKESVSTISSPCPYDLGWIIMCTGLTVGSCRKCPIHTTMSKL